MAHATALTLLEMTGRAGTGVSTAVDVAGRSSLRLWLVATEVDDTLAVVVETSRTGLVWRTLGAFAAQSEPAEVKLAVPDADRYVRATWAATGLGATFSLEGEAAQVYATPRELKRYLPPAVVEGISDADLDEALEDASDVVTGYLAEVATMPLQAWGDDIRRAVVSIAGYDLMSFLGYNPDGSDVNYRKRYEDAIAWLEAVAIGRVKPAGIVGSPAVDGVDPGETFTVVSECPRGWGQSRRCRNGVDYDGFDCTDPLSR